MRNKDTCQDDSGVPSVSRASDSHWYLTSISSFGSVKIELFKVNSNLIKIK